MGESVHVLTSPHVHFVHCLTFIKTVRQEDVAVQHTQVIRPRQLYQSAAVSDGSHYRSAATDDVHTGHAIVVIFITTDDEIAVTEVTTLRSVEAALLWLRPEVY
jgi:hypothetical protein